MTTGRTAWPRGIQRESSDPLRHPCPICGVGEGDPCEPQRSSRYATILRPHKGRGAPPWVLEREGYVQRADGLWRKGRR